MRSSKLTNRLPVLVAAAAILPLMGAAAVSRATITVQQWYRGGEADPGAANGAAVSPVAVDSGPAAINLTPTGSPTWDTASTAPGSTVSYSFNGGNYMEANSIATAISGANPDNFGIEAWIQPSGGGSSSANQEPFIVGCGDYNGFGLLTKYATPTTVTVSGYIAGYTFVGGTPTTDGQWTQVALVDSNNSTQLYVNGAAAGSAVAVPANELTSIAAFTDIGGGRATPTSTTAGSFAGQVDEARVFTFASGAFSTSDLQYPSVPEPATLGLLAVGALGLLLIKPRRA